MSDIKIGGIYCLKILDSIQIRIDSINKRKVYFTFINTPHKQLLYKSDYWPFDATFFDHFRPVYCVEGFEV